MAHFLLVHGAWHGAWLDGARVFEPRTGHDPMISSPEALTDLLLQRG